MITPFQPTCFQGWINAVFNSVWTYLILAVFFLLLLILTLAACWRSKKNKANRRPAQPLGPGSDPGSCEDQLLRSIQTLTGRPQTILLAAAGLDCMPVTIPIRIAMNSSGQKKRCLLIDLDTRRNAVWKAFGLDVKDGPAPSFPAPSGIQNLAILPAHYFERTRSMNIRAITKNAKNQYDLILINAPFLDGHPDRKLITASSRYAFVFAKETAQVDRLKKLCRAERCKVLGCFRIQKNGSAAPNGRQEASPPPRP